jgi:hypothetical protein
MIVKVPAYAIFTDECIHRHFYGSIDYAIKKIARRNCVPYFWEHDDMRMMWVLFMVQYSVYPMKLEPPVGVV